MNKPEPINAQPKILITKRMLSQIASKAISEAKGRFTDQDIYEKVKDKAVSANWKTLLDETCWSIAKTAIKNHATPHMDGDNDWFGYGETVIKLPGGVCVKVEHANDGDLKIRDGNVLDNAAKINEAAEKERARIAKIREVMRDRNLTYAGDAIKILAAE